MAIFSEANHVNQNIFPELLPVSYSESANSSYTFDIMCIYSYNRSAEWLHNVRCEWEAASILRISSEAHLVIGYEVNAAISCEFWQLA